MHLAYVITAKEGSEQEDTVKSRPKSFSLLHLETSKYLSDLRLYPSPLDAAREVTTGLFMRPKHDEEFPVLRLRLDL